MVFKILETNNLVSFVPTHQKYSGCLRICHNHNHYNGLNGNFTRPKGQKDVECDNLEGHQER
jgi:hypothetical protein